MSADHLFALPSDSIAVASDDCYTPRWVFDAMGLRFDLDVAAPPGGPWHVPCERTGETPIARERAIRDWAGCCTETTAGPTDGEADGPAVPTTRSLLRGLLSGVPEWVRRRAGVGGAGVGV